MFWDNLIFKTIKIYYLFTPIPSIKKIFFKYMLCYSSWKFFLFSYGYAGPGDMAEFRDLIIINPQ